MAYPLEPLSAKWQLHVAVLGTVEEAHQRAGLRFLQQARAKTRKQATTTKKTRTTTTTEFVGSA